MSKKNRLQNMTIAAVCLSLTQILPFFTGQIPRFGSMLTPMHIPVFLCGFLCTTEYALFVGAFAPLLRFALFGMPPIYPTGIAMCLELAAYGVISTLLYQRFKKKKYGLMLSLMLTMVAGRFIWGFVMMVLASISTVQFGWKMFLTVAFINAIPGIVIQILLIPGIVTVMKKIGGQK